MQKDTFHFEIFLQTLNLHHALVILILGICTKYGYIKFVHEHEWASKHAKAKADTNDYVLYAEKFTQWGQKADSNIDSTTRSGGLSLLLIWTWAMPQAKPSDSS